MSNESDSSRYNNGSPMKNTIKVMTQFEGFHQQYPRKRKSRYQNKRIRQKIKVIKVENSDLKVEVESDINVDLMPL